jgi:hypothetical protein
MWNRDNRSESFDPVRWRLNNAALAYACGDRSAVRRCVADDAAPHREIDRAAESLVDEAIGKAWENGWLPADLEQITRRSRDGTAVAYLCDAIAAQTRRYPVGSLHPRWQAQLDELGAEIWWEPDLPQLPQWARRHGHDRTVALITALELLALLYTLVPLPQLLPPPGGAATGTGTAQAMPLDDKVLARVRALLAKAESTTFPEEAEALSAKAQELVSRHAIARVMLDAQQPGSAPPTVRRLWLDRPYVGAKSTLVTAVARANRCRTVLYEQLGLVTVLGADTDLDIVDLLTTSLLLQATRAMLSTGRQVTRAGQSRTRSYRSSFLLAYAGRIRERLATATASAAAGFGGDLRPVLASREAAVEELVTRLFPTAARRTFTAGNSAGWEAGRAAADAAELQSRRAVGGG